MSAHNNGDNAAIGQLEQPLAGTYVIQNRRFTYVNSAFARIFGYSAPNEVIDSTKVYQLVSSDIRRYVAKNAGCHERSGNVNARCSFTGVRQDGSTFDVEVHNSVVEHAGVRFVVGVAVDMTEIRQMAHRGFYDSLTGLPNRALLFDRMTVALANAARNQSKCAVLFLDLDRFKPVNDNYGHAVGDAVLMTAAQRFSTVLRSPDTLARLGGDEFVVLIPDVDDQTDVTTIAKRLIHTLEEPIIVPEGQFNLGVSIGIAYYPDHGNTPQDLYRVADAAMYRAKARGKPNYAIAKRMVDTPRH